MFMKKKHKAGTQKEALEEKMEGTKHNSKEETQEAGDAGAPLPESPARRIPFTKAKTNNFVPKGRSGSK